MPHKGSGEGAATVYVALCQNSYLSAMSNFKQHITVP